MQKQMDKMFHKILTKKTTSSLVVDKQESNGPNTMLASLQSSLLRKATRKNTDRMEAGQLTTFMKQVPLPESESLDDTVTTQNKRKIKEALGESFVRKKTKVMEIASHKEGVNSEE